MPMGGPSFICSGEKLKSLSVYDLYEGVNTLEELERIGLFWQSKGVSFSALLYCSRRQYAEVVEVVSTRKFTFPVDVLSEKNLTFSLFPDQRSMTGLSFFSDRKVDVFVDLSRNFHYVDVSVAAVVNAGIKVGKPGRWNTSVNHCTLDVCQNGPHGEAMMEMFRHYMPVLGFSVLE